MTIDGLQLDKVQALLKQAGRSMPEKCESGEVQYIQSLLDALCDLSTRDSLTGLVNRRYFLAVLEQELDRVARAGESALLLMIDIDHFKRVNDEYGHLAGDAVIRAVGEALRTSARSMDTVARIGGEEFGVIVPNCPPSFAPQVAERIRQTVLGTVVSFHDQTIRVSISCGGAFAPGWLRTLADNWIDRADRLLYMAKEQGRNRVCIEDFPSSDVSAEEKGMLYGWALPDDLMIDDSKTV
jgi:diguanylate cyclase (GGDEF)-like protein